MSSRTQNLPFGLSAALRIFEPKFVVASLYFLPILPAFEIMSTISWSDFPVRAAVIICSKTFTGNLSSISIFNAIPVNCALSLHICILLIISCISPSYQIFSISAYVSSLAFLSLNLNTKLFWYITQDHRYFRPTPVCPTEHAKLWHIVLVMLGLRKWLSVYLQMFQVDLRSQFAL